MPKPALAGAKVSFMPISPKLGPEAAAANMEEIAPPYASQEALIEANRCLFCFDAPCIQCCPTGIDIPSFIKKIASGNLTGSARTILSANVLGASCARVCPTEVLCEGACVMVEKGERAIEIGRLQRFAVDHVLDRKIQLFQAGQSNGRRVACIGSGPASLACAALLARKGYSVTVFDRRELSGGLNTYGIAAYKTRVADSLREVEMVKSLGVAFRQNVEIGKDLSFAQLEIDFDAIFVGVGLGETWAMNIPGEDLHGVCGALEFIEATKSLPFSKVAIGRRVACIGAGNTAIDVVTAARRLGADPVYLIYRRSEQEMPAFRYEYELAKKDGVNFLWQTQPVRIAGSGGTVTGIECLRTRLGKPDERGKRSPETIPNSAFTIDVDMVVRAVGQKQATDFLRAVKGIEIRKNGTVVTDAQSRTGNAKYFAGGDCVNGGREVVDAVAEGMAAGRGIDALLGAATRKVS